MESPVDSDMGSSIGDLPPFVSYVDVMHRVKLRLEVNGPDDLEQILFHMEQHSSPASQEQLSTPQACGVCSRLDCVDGHAVDPDECHYHEAIFSFPKEQELSYATCATYLKQIVRFLTWEDHSMARCKVTLRGLYFPLEILKSIRRASIPVRKLALVDCTFGSRKEFFTLLCILPGFSRLDLIRTTWTQVDHRNDVNDDKGLALATRNFLGLKVETIDPSDLRAVYPLLDIDREDSGLSLSFCKLSVSWNAKWDERIAQDFKKTFPLTRFGYLRRLRVEVGINPILHGSNLGWILSLLPENIRPKQEGPTRGWLKAVQFDCSDMDPNTFKWPVWDDIERRLLKLRTNETGSGVTTVQFKAPRGLSAAYTQALLCKRLPNLTQARPAVAFLEQFFPNVFLPVVDADSAFVDNES
ncbi:unnamed protein product [Somion occarium]|uniref:Uncharacterized protein n=1 Tax=Somion occarium TaxID=3059160 RepID=A0ABP1DJX4_9APHY